MKIRIGFVFVFLMIAVVTIDAQYFGRNKPRYRTFNFEVLQTPHFDIYHYFKNDEVANRMGKMSEHWYDFHSDVFQEKILFKNPLIFYGNHAEFQQTNAISGNIGIGTGGVTEAFKNRVIMPLTLSNQQTYQVLGHELVHAFQFNNIIYGDSTSIQSLANLPLWLVEGMAEYMTLGRVDPFTSMWMRDAILNDDIPDIRQMANPKYFPYRYGQAMWAFLAGLYGDDILRPLFKSTAIFGIDYALDSLTNKSATEISGMWKSALKTHYNLEGKKEKPQGKLLLSSENSGNLNVSPSISPNGRYVIFLSEKDLFSTDLFLADARSGDIIRKISSQVKDTEIDNLNSIESAGAWSPNGREFAYIGFKKGKSVLIIKDAESGDKNETVSIPGLNYFAHPAWHPNGKDIVVAGLVDGQPDLYLYNLKSKKIVQLTNDIYSEILPNFNSTGDKLAFSYDKTSFGEGTKNGHYTYDIAIMDMSDYSIDVLDVFHGAENLNPNYDHEDNIYFISERDGYRNVYKYFTQTQKVWQVTDVLTGISGIARYSPAISAASKSDRMVYTHYYGNQYRLYQATSKSLLEIEVNDMKTIDQTAGTLPVYGLGQRDIVQNTLNHGKKWERRSDGNYKETRYNPKFKLDYIGGGTGVGVNSGTIGSNTALQGGIDMLFSDILGNNQLFSTVALNGEILDLGGQVAYLNRKNRLAYGAAFSHIPLRTGFRDQAVRDTINTTSGDLPVLRSDLNIIRIFDENLSAFAHFPFSTTLRLEGGVGMAYRSFRYDVYKEYYSNNINNPVLLAQERERLPIDDRVTFNQYYTLVKGFGTNVNAALVGDNSFFGLTSPLAGHRFRIGVEHFRGTDQYTSYTVDLRKYWYVKPFSFAIRTTNYLRFEEDVNSVYPFYVGNMGFVRGYGSIFSTELPDELGISFDDLIGSKLSMVSAEVRIPFTGPKRLALIGSNIFFTDLELFVDAGTVFNSFSNFTDEGVKRPYIARSAGFGVRINLFGALILEPYWAWPLQSGGSRTFGLNLIPGW